jgi:hypothetical protein
MKVNKDKEDMGCMAHFGFILIFCIGTFTVGVFTGGILAIPFAIMVVVIWIASMFNNGKFTCPRCGEVVK